ncbi:MAG TPA: outer membrane assembly protein BamC [Glaciecola sp.]|jgi:outer membrane protein assembly factor BamC|nr:outer membrane assembly protein BamC [Glaciecola sp.]
MNKSLIVTALSVCLLSGCASKVERRIASGSTDYATLPKITTTKVPPELQQPIVAPDYAIPQLAANPAAVYGRDLPVVSPSLVLPLARGTYITEDLTDTSVIFDKLDTDLSVEELVMLHIDAHLNRAGIAYTKPNPAKQRIVTDWIVSFEDADAAWYEFTTPSTEVGRRFELLINPAPHGRSATLTVNLIDLVVSNGTDISETIDPFTKRDFEAQMINAVIQQFASQQIIDDENRIAQIRSGINSELGFDANGDSAIIINAQYDITWPKFQLVLRKLGFDVKDLDKSTGLLFVKYQGLDESWIKGLFGSTRELPLEKTDYRILIKKLTDEKSSVTFMDDQSKSLTPLLVSDLYPAFAEVLGQNELDI